MQVENIQDITLEVLKQAVAKATNEGFKNHAPLGASGDRIILYHEKENNTHSRPSQISVRLHSSGVELLVTNRNGDFLFYGKFHPDLGGNYIAKRFKETLDHIGEGLILGDSRELMQFRYKTVGTKPSWKQKFMLFLFKLNIQGDD